MEWVHSLDLEYDLSFTAHATCRAGHFNRCYRACDRSRWRRILESVAPGVVGRC